MGAAIPGFSQAWSVGVEEQFYLFWPLILLFFYKQRLPVIFILIGLFLLTLRIVLPHIYANGVVIKFIGSFHIELMAVGAIGGYLQFYYSELIKKYTSNIFIYLAIIVLIGITLSISIVPQVLQNFLIGILFIILIIYTVNQSAFVLRNNILDYLGKISYGIYMYHPLVMFLVFPFSYKYIERDNHFALFNLVNYITIYGLTIIISHISYKYFEYKFISIKDTKFKS